MIFTGIHSYVLSDWHFPRQWWSDADVAQHNAAVAQRRRRKFEGKAAKYRRFATRREQSFATLILEGVSWPVLHRFCDSDAAGRQASLALAAHYTRMAERVR